MEININKTKIEFSGIENKDIENKTEDGFNESLNFNDETHDIPEIGTHGIKQDDMPEKLNKTKSCPPSNRTDEHKILLKKVKQYQYHFKNVITTKLNDIDKLPFEDLQEKYKEIKFELSCSNNYMYETALYSLPLIEKVACERTPLKLNGFSSSLMTNNNFLMTLRELSIENNSLMCLPAEKRIFMIIGMAAMMTHQVNVIKEIKSNEIDKSMNEDIAPEDEKKYGDL
jgi:hypothetical protein